MGLAPVFAVYIFLLANHAPLLIIKTVDYTPLFIKVLLKTQMSSMVSMNKS